MASHFVIRRATTPDREVVLPTVAAWMQESGLVTDFSGLDADICRIGENREGTIVVGSTTK